MTTTPPDRIDRIEAAIEVLVEGQTRLQDVQVEMSATQAQLGQTQELMAQLMVSLNAGQERQERILDYLIRRDGERGN